MLRPTRIAFAIVGTTILLTCLTATAQVMEIGPSHATEVGKGVYAIVHDDAPDGNPNGNTTVIIGDNGVFVVDSCFMLSAARADIALIRQWTNKPVRYLLNTHSTNDHNMGNGVYKEAFPSVDIVAQVETGPNMYRVPNTPARYARYAEQREKIARSGKSEDGRPLTKEERQAAIEMAEAKKRVRDELKDFHYQSPTISFDAAFDADLGNREVEVRFLGRGVTAGDAIAYLPKEKILVAGELVTHPVMFTFTGYPSEWVNTLERLSSMDIQTIVPAHGSVLHGTDYLGLEREFLESAVGQVHRQLETLTAIKENPSFADVRKNVDLRSFRERFAGNNKEEQEFFDEASEALIRVAYDEAMHNAITPQ